jgi:type III pantothenate kinase
MNLVIDSGNSAIKVGIFEYQNLISTTSFVSEDDLRNFLQSTKVTNAIISSVKTKPDVIASWIGSGKVFILDQSLPLPINNQYRTKSTLGVDRIAAACGAWQLFPFHASLAIDAGTCITYEFVDSHANYLGGAISPGLMMRFKAVHTFTARLPLLSPANHVELIGDSTDTCIQSGIINGMISEINGIIERYQSQYDDLRVILCGGDARFFENKLKASIFASPELVLLGLNSILIHNVSL